MPRKKLKPEPAELLKADLARRWPEGTIPRELGGPYFREVCDRVPGVEEWQVSELARRLGYWPPKAYEHPSPRNG